MQATLPSYRAQALLMGLLPHFPGGHRSEGDKAPRLASRRPERRGQMAPSPMSLLPSR